MADAMIRWPAFRAAGTPVGKTFYFAPVPS